MTSLKRNRKLLRYGFGLIDESAKRLRNLQRIPTFYFDVGTGLKTGNFFATHALKNKSSFVDSYIYGVRGSAKRSDKPVLSSYYLERDPRCIPMKFIVATVVFFALNASTFAL